MAYQLITVYSITTYRSVVNSFWGFYIVAEDDPVITWAMQRHLERWGYPVVCAEQFDNVLAECAALSPSGISSSPFSTAATGPGEPKGVQSPHPVSHLCLLPCQIQRQHAGDGHTREPKNVGSSSHKSNNENADEVTFHSEKANHSNKLSLPKI